MGAHVTGGPPDIVVECSAAWAQVTVDDDIAAWAPVAAGRLWALAGVSPLGAFDVDLLAAELQVMAKSAFVVPCFGAFILCPEPSRGPRAVLRLSGLRYPVGTGDREIVDEILVPADRQLLSPQVERLGGLGPQRFRVRQRAWSEDTRAVADYIAYVLPFDEGAWMLSTSLPDAREAERWLPELDELAAGVQLR